MSRLLIILGLISVSLTGTAQFSGLTSFNWDTTLRSLIKANRVSSVTELIKEDSTFHFNGKYFFDTDGRATDQVTGRGPYYTRMSFAYNKNGMVTKQVHYNNSDTSKVESWSIRTYDAKNRMLKSVKGYMNEGKAIVNTEYENRFISEKKGAGKIESKQFDGANLRSVTISRDSISGKDTFMVSYEYGTEVRTGKRITFAKSLNRSYVKDRCYYDDEVKYNVYGKTEAAQKMVTEYLQLDEKGRWVGRGEINYDEAYEAFVQEHPEDFNPNYYSPLFIKEIFAGRIKGKRKSEEEKTISADGLLLQTEAHGFRTVFKYNEKKQLTEQLTYHEQKLTRTLQFLYNDKGLLIKTLNTYKNNQENGVLKTMVEEMSYSYTFY